MTSKLHQFKLLLLGLMLSLVTLGAQAEQKIKKGNWDVHYIAFNSTFLTPDVAKEYGIVRSKYNGLINISVLDTAKDSEAQRVFVKGSAKNLVGQEKELKFKQITEGKSIYYICQFSFANEETFRFEITVSQGNRSETIKFTEKMYAQ